VGKISETLYKIPENLNNPLENMRKWHPTCFHLKKMAPKITRTASFFGQKSFAPPKISLLLYLCAQATIE